MFTVGQKVVCVDDRFPGPLRRLYSSLPVKDVTYTVRAVYPGRRIAFPKPGTTSDQVEVGILLKELTNPPDPRVGTREVGFNVDRFRPLQEQQIGRAHV